MIKLTIEATGGFKRVIMIRNDGTHRNRPKMGNYLIVHDDPEDPEDPRDFTVKNHNREHGMGPLLKRVIDGVELKK